MYVLYLLCLDFSRRAWLQRSRSASTGSASTARSREPDVQISGDSAGLTGITNRCSQFPCGSLVALFMNKYRDEIPQIARIAAEPSNESDVTEVEWLVGTYSSTFKPCKRRVGRSYVPWTETVPYTAILFSVQLTKGCQISQSLRTKLTEAYSELGV